MKLVVVLSIAISAVALSSAQPSKLCPYPDLSADEYGKLTYCWAQEAIGVPEAHALLKSFNDYTPSRIGIFDVGFEVSTLIEQARLSTEFTDHLHLSTPPTDAPSIVQDVYYIDAILRQMGVDKEERDTLLSVYYFGKTGRKARHGTAVARLVAGESPLGVSAHGEIDFLFLLLKKSPPVVDRETGEVTLNFEDVIYRLGLVIDSLPDIVNQSASFNPLGTVFTPPEIQEQYAKIAQKTLFVTSAGNGFPNPINSGKRELYDKIIIVCSIKPSGEISSFSPYNDKTTICAPSNARVLQTTGEEGSIAFGGTSGASPLVAGALADVMSILPTLTVSEARQMLQKTAIISRDGTAVLNYYKLIEVAIKLANIGWPKHREQIFTDDLYDFTAESHQYLASDDASEAQAFANLRRAFFLQSDNSTAREKLAEIYAQAGYETQALFYGNDSVPPRDNREYDYLTAIADADIEKLAQILAVPDAKDFYNQVFITSLLRDLNKNDRQAVVKVLKENQIEIRTVFED